jgi:hypothetical protein
MVGELLRGESRIRFVCKRHTERDPVGPLVTIIDGAWALCVGHALSGHDWAEIEPTQLEHLSGPTQAQDRDARTER